MTDHTLKVLRKLIAMERQEVCPEHGADCAEPFPVARPEEWDGWSACVTFRWAALLALEEGDTATASVLAQLATGASIDRVGMEMFMPMGGEES